MQFRATKVVSTLPGTLTPNTVYLVRVGAGFDHYVSDSTGAVAHKVNATYISVGTTAPSNPAVNDLWLDTN